MIIRPANAGDVDAVVALLHEKMNRKIAPDRWRRLMTYPWLDPKPDLGTVAVEADGADGAVVGFVGAVHADRMIGGRTERLVNICAWYLDKAHRGDGAGTRLMAAATANSEWHYTIMTSSARTVGILAEVGYRELDTHRFDWCRSGGSMLDVLAGDAIPPDRISAAERRILADHAGLPITPILFLWEGGETLAIFSITEKGDDQPWYDLLYVADTALLARHGQAVADSILPSSDAVLSADARFCGSATPAGADAVRLPVPRFVKSDRLSGPAVDHLYTELQLMGLKLD